MAKNNLNNANKIKVGMVLQLWILEILNVTELYIK